MMKSKKNVQKKWKAWGILNPEGELSNVSLDGSFAEFAGDGWKNIRVEIRELRGASGRKKG